MGTYHTLLACPVRCLTELDPDSTHALRWTQNGDDDEDGQKLSSGISNLAVVLVLNNNNS